MERWWDWNFRLKPFTDHLVRFTGYPFYGLQYIEMIGFFSSKKAVCIMMEEIYRN